MPCHDSPVRQRQQGRDAAQFARRARAERARRGRGLRRRRRAGHHRAPARRSPPHHARRRARRSRGARWRPRPTVEFNIEGDPRPGPARAGATRCGPTSARSCRSCPARSRARPAGSRGPQTDRLPDVVAAAASRAAFASACSSIPTPEPIDWAASSRRRSRRALHRAVRAGVRARAAEARRVVRGVRRRGAARALARAGRQRRPRSRSRQPRAVPRRCRILDEVSIGHAIMSRALFVGLATVVREYLAVLPALDRSIQPFDHRSQADPSLSAMKIRIAIAFGIAGIAVRPDRRLGHRQRSRRRVRRRRAAAAQAARRAAPARRQPRARAAPRRDAGQRRSSRSPSASRRTPQPRVQLGNLYFDAERYDEAITWYSEALKLAPNDVNVSTDLGVCYYYTNQPDKALAQFDALAASSIRSTPRRC